MTDRRLEALFRFGPWLEPSFWDEVEFEIEGLDLEDFEEFEAAGDLPSDPRPEFERDLRESLQRLLPLRH